MGYHGFRDSLFCSINGLKLGLKGKKFFSVNLESPRLADVYELCSAVIPRIESAEVYPVQAMVSGKTVNTRIHVLQWLGEGYPVLLYHHISNEQPLDYSCRKIFLQPKDPFRANIILIQGIYHDEPGSFTECSVDLQLFAEMTAMSVRIIDECIAQFLSRKMSSIVCGLKLGGWIANLHHALSNSAAAYIPLLAGAGFGDIFFDSEFAQCVSSSAKKNHQKVRRTLNFDDVFMARANHSNVFPLLAVHDRISIFVRQRPAYGDMKFALMNKGHITGASSFSKIRNHCRQVMDKVKK